jgi:exodeoxyribonuclease-3
VGTEKYDLKLEWLDRLTDWLKDNHDPSEPLIAAGDFNIAPDDRDVYDPKVWRGKVLCSEPERDRLKILLDWGFADLLREHTDEGGIYSWWDYRHGAFHRGMGLRIDLILGTAPMAERLLSVEVDRNERKPKSGPGKPSDHAPVIAEFRDSP